MARTQEELVREEQVILNNLIREMDQTLIQLDKKLTYDKLQAQKAREACLPDTYGMLVSSEHDKIAVRQKMRDLYKGKDELYETRLVLDITDEQGQAREEVKIGLHTYLNGTRIFIMSWKMPLCRHYILDNSAEEYDNVVTGKHGQTYKTHYQLCLKRQVKMFFDKIQSVTHFFPSMDEEEEIIADEFLQELLKRRSGQEFKNIVFSIQKKQGEIIQTPFKQNLIVQGCAGSGKSMIMLHRLPIVIYDNPNSLDRNHLYIITPSVAYIQMAENMRRDLEIDDLKMGTLEQYYNHVIEKYRVNPDVYGSIKPYIKVSEADLAYVYSSECVRDVKNKIKEIINDGTVDYKTGYTFFNLTENEGAKVIATPTERIRAELLKIQKVIDVNDSSLKTYHRNILNILTQLEECARMLENRKITINRAIMRSIAAEEQLIVKKEKEISKLNNVEGHEVMYKNRLSSIKAAKERIVDLEDTKDIVELDDVYFEKLKEMANKIRQLISLFTMMKTERIKMNIDAQYQAISKKAILCEGCGVILKEIEQLEDPYWEYAYSIMSETKKLENSLADLINNKNQYLPEEYLKKLIDAKTYYTEATENTVQKIYISLMKRLGQEPNEKGRLDALECSPYLYLQILYLFRGLPNEEKESLITIDEAQNIAPEELKLIAAVNENKVILNLFGDVKQHVEGSKGIDDWKEFSNIADFKKESMQENYRNARQITSYCNKRFGLNMRAINSDGTGVHECRTKEEFENAFTRIFQKPQNIGLSCIIVKNQAEAQTLLYKADNFRTRIHNMVSEIIGLQRNKWNLMTAEQAKGLEFETVFALSGRMSENEKYITYTRALDELYVYDEEMELIEISPDTVPEKKIEKELNENSARKKRIKRASSETTAEKGSKGLKDFFEKKRLKVIDDRKKSGHLWVLGSKDEINGAVAEAIEIYGVSGSYGSSKISGFKEGWFTKSKK